MRLRERVGPHLPFLLTVVGIAALSEFLLLRLLLRGGAFAPASPSIDLLFDTFLRLGLVGLTVAFLISGLLLVLVAVLLWRGRLSRILALLLVALVVWGALPALFAEAVFPFVYAWIGMAVLVTLVLFAPRQRSWQYAGSLAVLLAVGLTFYHQATTNAAALGWSLPGGSAVFNAGEIVVVAAPILFLLGRRWWRWGAVLAALAGLGYFLISASPIVPLVAAWTVYLTYFLPTPVYAVAFAALVYVLGDMLRHPTERWMGFGLLLVVLAGRMFQSTYLAQLSLLGTLVLVLPLSLLLAAAGRDARPTSSGLDSHWTEGRSAGSSSEARNL